ncbi:MAG TPA: hypothetical protein VMG35_20230 [Bryobacteraceae bacterium]|nr:hypothetical protein [Bryobacteraceae bacterium]
MTGTDLLLFATCGAAAIFQGYYLVRILWRLPLSHGPGFFLSTEVPPGFYEGAGMQWMRRYHAVLVLIHGIEGIILVYLVASRHWDQIPLLAPVFVALFFSMFGGFVVWARRTLGAAPPRLPAVAVPMKARRLGDYVSWPREILMAAIIAGIWLLWRFHGGIPVSEPILATYVVMGLVPAEILIVRNSFPVPPERSEEHERWLEANRRFSLRLIELMRWFWLIAFAGPAVLQSWPATGAATSLRWILGAILTGLWFAAMWLLIPGYGRLLAMGRDLRPVGSWSGPFRPARLMPRGGLTWGISYSAGLAILLAIVLR